MMGNETFEVVSVQSGCRHLPLPLLVHASKCMFCVSSTAHCDDTVCAAVSCALTGCSCNVNECLAGVIGLWPSRAVTFLDNHDTGSTLNHWPYPWKNLPEGYAYLITHSGECLLSTTCACYRVFLDEIRTLEEDEGEDTNETVKSAPQGNAGDEGKHEG